MAEIDYAFEKITGALDGMAYSPKRIQDRLYDACQAMNVVDANKFPPELQGEWSAFYGPVTAISDESLGSFRASTMHMSEEEAVECARRLTTFRHRVEAYIKDRTI